MDVFNQEEMATKNLQLEKGNFLWFKLFVEVLIHMKDNTQAHHDLVEILRMNYPQSNFISDFAQNYAADRAIEWFTRDDSYLLKELNKALRQQHLDHLFLFRYLINDIYQQLKKEHNKLTKDNTNIITLYSSQVISQSELNQLLEEADTSKLIAINSFMLTWTDQTKAINFLKTRREVGLASVFFEIEVDYRKKSSPFAQINIKEEDLILFMLGCIFRIRSITEANASDCYVLKLELCGDDDADVKIIFDYMKKDFIQSETDLITLGSLLRRMGELNKARKYFELTLSELDQYDSNRAHCFDGLGNIENDQGQPKKALEHHQQALELRMNNDLTQTNYSLIALSHIHIANDYKDIGDDNNYNTALEHVKKARILIRKQNLQEDQAKEAACYIIEGSILYEKEVVIEALDKFEQALNINKQQGMPDDHPDLASIYQNMGLCHLNSDAGIHNPTLALDYSIKALTIKLKALPHSHRSMGITYRSIGLAYEKLNNYKHALEYLKKALAVFKSLNRYSDDVKATEKDIKSIEG
jgi:tetratricopeptide (TPR) repeat protein